MSPGEPGRPIVFGEVLYDRFPDGTAVLGGAPFNVAWHLQALGLAPLLVTRIGRDGAGEGILEAMARWGMDRAGVQRDDERPTGAVTVTLAGGEPRYTIAPDQAWDHLDPAALPAAPGTGLLYHGTLALRAAPARAAWEGLRQRAGGPVLVDVNLRAPWYEPEAVLAAVRRARWAKLNQEELALLVPGAAGADQGVRQLLTAPGPEAVILTRGASGSTLYEGQNAYSASVPQADPVDTVGAGDAYASVVILGLARGWPRREIPARAAAFAAGVVGLRGATTEESAFYDPYLEEWGLR